MTDDDDAAPAQPRRDFLNLAIAGAATTLGALGALPVGHFLSAGAPPAARRGHAGDLDDFPRGTARALMVGERPALVIRLGDGSFRAYVALCTHLHCVVRYSPEHQRIECPCHRGVFSLEGQNVAGPPPRPLERLAVDIADGVVTVREA